MAPKGRNESHTNGQGKGNFRFRYMDSNRQFEVQADNVDGENLLEGFRHVANAITGRNISAAAPKLLKKAGGATPTDILEQKEEETIDTDVLPFPDQPPAEEREEQEEETNATPSERKQRSAPRAPKFLDELNLTTAKVSLADFVREKNPDNDVDKYAVIAVWFKQHFNTEEISIDHIFTAYDTLGWRAQMPGPDPSQTFRNLKNNKNWLASGTKRGFYRVNWNGEDAVNKMGAAKTP